MLKKIICFFSFLGVATNSFGMTEGRVAEIAKVTFKQMASKVEWSKVASTGITQVCGVSAFCVKAAWNQFGFSLIPTLLCGGLLYKVRLLENKLDDVHKRTIATDERTKVMQTEQIRQGSQLETIYGQWEPVKSAADIINHRFPQLEKAISGINEKLDQHTKGINALFTQVSTLKDEVISQGCTTRTEVVNKMTTMINNVQTGFTDNLNKFKEDIESMFGKETDKMTKIITQKLDYVTEFTKKLEKEGDENKQQFVALIDQQKECYSKAQKTMEEMKLDGDMYYRENQASFEKINRKLEKLTIQNQCLEGLWLLTRQCMNRNEISSVGIIGANIGASINGYAKTKGKGFNINSAEKKNKNLIHFDMGSSDGID